MADKKLDFIVIPNKVMYCKNLTANAKLLMGVIIILSNGRGNCWASNNYLAEILGIHKMTISKWINSLEKNGFIKCKVKKDNKRKIYIDPCISESIEIYVKLLIDYKSNSLHIHKATALSKDAVAKKNNININNKTNPQTNKDDFDIEEKEWTDKNGKKHKRVSIDYGYEEENNPQ